VAETQAVYYRARDGSEPVNDYIDALEHGVRRRLNFRWIAALPDKEGVVDVAVTVGDRWQGRGLGTALLARLIERARDEGHLALHATVLAENRASIAMLRRAGFASRSGTGVLLEFEFAVTPPAPSTVLAARRENP
jgi:GNAT superfamily N-acetyltransferase